MAQSQRGGVAWVLRDNFGLLIGVGGEGGLHGSSALMVEALANLAALMPQQLQLQRSERKSGALIPSHFNKE
ncbi:hypothetical protein GBA52_024975 [Prunus armeniaca]|nr:hypothetical protein GBA52_024975 [Prunus armeniaca]